MKKTVRFTAAGDFLAQRKLYETYDGMEKVRDFILRGDFRFFNLETTFPDETCFGNQYYGGSHLRADKRVLEDAKAFGFNILSFANNHTMDYSHDGLRGLRGQFGRTARLPRHTRSGDANGREYEGRVDAGGVLQAHGGA